MSASPKTPASRVDEREVAFAPSAPHDDFNADGRQDLAIASADDNVVSVLLGKGSGAFNARSTYAVGSSPTTVIKGDYNGDALGDIMVLNEQARTFSLLVNTGTGAFAAQKVYLTDRGPISGMPGDFNEDGKLDFSFATSGQNGLFHLIYTGCH